MKDKIKIVYDATILAQGLEKNSGRSGIYFVALNILKILLKKDINIILYCQSDKFKNLKNAIEKELNLKKIKILHNSKSVFHENLKNQSNKLKIEHKIIKKILLQLFLIVVSPIFKLYEFFYEIYLNKNLLKYDVFFSPVFIIPENVQINHCTILYDLIPKLLPAYHRDTDKNSWYGRLIDSLNQNDFYFAISEHTRQDFLKYFPQIDPNKITTTLLACDEKFEPKGKNLNPDIRVKYNIPEGKKYIFSLCSLEPRKNLIRTVKTFIQFVKKNNIDDTVFVLGGGQWDEFIPKLDAEIEGLGEYKDKIIKAGYVDDEDLPALYSAAEWFVYTSMYEGFGLPPLEAMSCGCPVITSNNSSLPEVVGDAGIMIDWDSDEQHIEAYEKYYFDKDLKESNSRKGLTRAKQFSWEKCVNEMIESIKKVELYGRQKTI